MLTKGLIVAVVLGVGVSLVPRKLDMHSVEMEKCPACYGVDFCPPLLTGKVTLRGDSALATVMHFNAKNVFFADFQERLVSSVSTAKRGKASVVLSLC